MTVHDEKGGWTKEAQNLANELNKVLYPIIDKYQKEGMTPEAIMYVTNSEVEMRCLFNRFEERKKKQNNL